MSTDVATPEVSRPGLWRGPLWLGNALIVVLGLLSPTAVFIALRIGLIRSCTGIDFLHLPWHPAVSTAVMVLAIGVALGSLVSLVFGYGTRGLRASAISLTVGGLLSVIPVLLALFMSVYGDPGPVCNPV